MRSLLLTVAFVLALPAIVLACFFYDGKAHDLHTWARQGNVEKVRELLDDGLSPNAIIRDFHPKSLLDVVATKTLLAAAAQNEDAAVVELLLARGADVDARGGHGTTALMSSARRDYPDVTRVLLEAGADPAARDLDGRTALEHCMHDGGSVRTALLLFDATKGIVDAERIVERAVAIARGRVTGYSSDPLVHTCVSAFEAWLRERRGGGDPTLCVLARAPARVDELALAVRSSAAVDERDAGGWTALMWAAGMLGDDEKTRLLLDAGADPNVASPDGWTALLAATEAGAVERVRLLLEAGADPDHVERVSGNSALHVAVRDPPDAEIVQVLLDAGADSRLQNDRGALAVDASYGSRYDAAVRAALEQALKDDPLRANDIVLLRDEPLRRRLTDSIQIQDVVLSAHEGGERLAFRTFVRRVPVDIAFDVSVRLDGREFASGTWCVSKGGSFWTEFTCDLPVTNSRIVDLVFRPSPSLAVARLESGRIWGEEIVFEEFPCERARFWSGIWSSR